MPPLEELTADPHPEIRAGALDYKKYVEARLAIDISQPNKPAVPGPSGVFQQVPLTYGIRKSTGDPAVLGLSYCLPVGPKLDFLTSNAGLLLLAESGVLKPLTKSSAQRYCYDGRYVWFCVTSYFKVPRLVVLDPVTEKMWEVLEADGLPIAAPDSLPNKDTLQDIAVAPLGPGKVLLAGSFGKSWLAIATFDPREERKSVKVFHEARETAVANGQNQWTRTTIAFQPACMFVLEGDKSARRILIGRESTDPLIENHPLLVDPEGLKVEVMKDSVSIQSLKRGSVHQGSVYYSGHGKQLFKIDFPGHERKPVMKDVPDGQVLLVGDEIYVASLQKELWHGSLANKQIQRVSPMPNGDLRFIGRSSNYGILLSTWDPEDRYKIYQVKVSSK